MHYEIAAKMALQMQRTGRVFVASVPPADRDVRVRGDRYARFWATWEDEIGGGDTFYAVTVEEAIAWGRSRARVVLVRVGSEYFSAGDSPVFDDDGERLRRWQPGSR